MEHVRMTLVMRLELQSEFAKTAAEELGVSDVVGRDLHHEVGRSIGRLVEERASELEAEAVRTKLHGSGGESAS